MAVNAKILVDVKLENETKALAMLNKSINNEYEELFLYDVEDVESLECSNVVVKEIVTIDEDGNQVELYKTNEINYQLVKSSRKHIKNKDIIFIDNVAYIVVPVKQGVNLYSIEKTEFFFENDLKGIQEIHALFEEKNIVYEIYTY